MRLVQRDDSFHLLDAPAHLRYLRYLPLDSAEHLFYSGSQGGFPVVRLRIHPLDLSRGARAGSRPPAILRCGASRATRAPGLLWTSSVSGAHPDRLVPRRGSAPAPRAATQSPDPTASRQDPKRRESHRTRGANQCPRPSPASIRLTAAGASSPIPSSRR